MKRHLASAEILVSSEYQVKDNYLPGEEGNPEDFRWLRIGIWHEIIELAIIYMATEGFCFPYWMYHNLLDTEKRGEGAKNFAHNAVCEVQASLENERSLWLHWDGDPPFDAFEVGAYTRENEARRLEEDAIRLEGQGNWAGAREKWIEAEQAWERALKAWQAVPRHPGRGQRIKDAQTKLAEARERKEVALWMAASWDVTSTSTGEINIRYSAWPVRFKVKIADVKGHVLASFDKPSGTGVIIWGKGEKAGLYFIRVEAERIKPMVRKIVIF
ncbi:MAG: T9SS type A sorting domain-containing protein [candidate division WOR-3 bacterium]|nr:T9SS type A sorting domain-containing protein [candidate division WOR-3 bacterium]